MHSEASQIIPGDSEDLRYPFESRIPPDILELIFESGARDAQRQVSTFQVEYCKFSKPIEVVVSLVNRRWREVAVNLAVLWSFIRASPFEPLGKIKWYLDKSKAHALTVCLFAYKEYSRPDIITAMKEHLPRFRRFHLITDFIQSTSTGSSHLALFEMPALECFLYTPLDSPNFHSPSNTLQLIPLRAAPSLASVRLNGPMFDLIRPPFSGISQLCLTEERFPIPFRSICEILKSCVSLLKFAFSGHTQRPHRRLATPHDVIPFTLPELRCLMLSNGGNSDVILSVMTAPKLSILRLNNFEEEDLGYFLQLSQDSKFPVLESLAFRDNTFSIGAYHDIARIFPAIRSFSSLNSLYTDDVLEFLVPLPTSRGATHMPWPNLGTLLFNQAQFQDKHQTMLCTLVAARIALRAPILNLFLGRANRLLLDTDRLDWLRERLRVDESWEMPEDEELGVLADFAGDANIY
ncbi:hypothetical protein C8R44DRAFT_985407 [Mycena epipterygia]|nr:hypothetical protein C8R44DRAFT_985407 [Mycena epipterygia]